MQIKRITLNDCIPLRRSVLWPNATDPDAWQVDGDENAEHFGVVIDGAIVSILSVFSIDSATCQIRKVATQSAVQGRGYGRALMCYVLNQLARKHVVRAILDARVSAIPFYAQFHFVPEGDFFFKRGVPHQKMVLRLDIEHDFINSLEDFAPAS